MPSETFKNLDENKKQRLIKAAIEEFSRVSFSDFAWKFLYVF